MPVVRVSLRHGVRGSNGSADDAHLKCRVDRSCRRLCRDRSDRRYAGAGDADAPWCVGVAVLIAGMLLFSLRWVGGGDAKLLAAAALWIGYEQFTPLPRHRDDFWRRAGAFSVGLSERAGQRFAAASLGSPPALRWREHAVRHSNRCRGTRRLSADNLAGAARGLGHIGVPEGSQASICDGD